MKLLVDCHCFDYPTPQGINTYIKGLYTSLVPIAKDVDFYFAANDTNNLKLIFGEYRNVFYIKIPHCGSLSRLLGIFPTLIREYSIDWAHFQYVGPLFKACKTIVTLHDILFLDFPKYFPLSYRISKGLMFRYAAKRADLLLTVSSYSKRQITQHYNIKAENIFVTPNAITDRFSLIKKEDANEFVRQKYGLEKYVLYVSRLEPRKDQFGLIKAFIESGVYKHGVSLVIVGEETIHDNRIDEYLARLDETAKGRIIFLKGILDYELANLYRGAALFVYPSKAEGFGIPPLESAVSEITTICNNQTAMKDFDFFGERLIDTSDTSKLADMIRESLQKPLCCNELSLLKKQVLEKYNWNNIAQEFYKILTYQNLRNR